MAVIVDLRQVIRATRRSDRRANHIRPRACGNHHCRGVAGTATVVP